MAYSRWRSSPWPADIKEYAALVASGNLSQDTFLRKMAAAEEFDALDQWSVEEEMERIEDERPEPVAELLPPEEPEEEEDDDAGEEDQEMLDGKLTEDEPTSSES